MDGSINPPNPKQRYGDLKVPLGLVPSSSIIYEALALKQGAEKYGPYNWRETGVEAMTYVHAAERHLRAWLDGEEMDPESGIPHLGHAKACLGILIDADECGKLINNRPLPAPTGDLLFVWAADDIMGDNPTVSDLMQRRNEARWGEGMYGPLTAPTDWWSGYVPSTPDDDHYPFTSHRSMAEIMETEEAVNLVCKNPLEAAIEHYGVPAYLQVQRQMNQEAAFGEGDETPVGCSERAHAWLVADCPTCNPVPMPTGDAEGPSIFRHPGAQCSCNGTGVIGGVIAKCLCNGDGGANPVPKPCQLDGRNCPPDHDHRPKWEAMTKRPCMCERGRCKVDNGWTLGLDVYCCQGERG